MRGQLSQSQQACDSQRGKQPGC